MKREYTSPIFDMLNMNRYVIWSAAKLATNERWAVYKQVVVVKVLFEIMEVR